MTKTATKLTTSIPRHCWFVENGDYVLVWFSQFFCCVMDKVLFYKCKSNVLKIEKAVVYTFERNRYSDVTGRFAYFTDEYLESYRQADQKLYQMDAKDIYMNRDKAMELFAKGDFKNVASDTLRVNNILYGLDFKPIKRRANINYITMHSQMSYFTDNEVQQFVDLLKKNPSVHELEMYEVPYYNHDEDAPDKVPVFTVEFTKKQFEKYSAEKGMFEKDNMILNMLGLDKFKKKIKVDERKKW